jgi:hypothetical protein
MMHRVAAARLKEEARRGPLRVAAKGGRARGWLNDAAAVLMGPLDAFVAVTPCSTTKRVHTEAQTGIPALRTFLVAIAEAAGADPAGPQ